MRISKELAVSNFKNIIVETNFLTSLFNKKDAHRPIFEKIVKDSNNIYVPWIAFKESAKSFSNKLNHIHTFLVLKYIKIDLSKDNSEIYEEEEKILEELNLKYASNINFNKYLLDFSRDLRLKHFDKSEFIFALSEHVLNIGNIGAFKEKVEFHANELNLDVKLEVIPNPDINKKTVQKRYKRIEKAIESVKYNDEPDRRLFLNSIYYYPKRYECPVSFISSDFEFIEKSKLSLTELNTQINFDTSKITMVYIYDIFEKPIN